MLEQKFQRVHARKRDHLGSRFLESSRTCSRKREQQEKIAPILEPGKLLCVICYEMYFYDDEWLRETKKSMMGSSILEIITNLILQVRLGEWEEATTKFKLIRRTSLTSCISSDGTFGFILLKLNRSVKRPSHNLAIRLQL